MSLKRAKRPSYEALSEACMALSAQRLEVEDALARADAERAPRLTKQIAHIRSVAKFLDDQALLAMRSDLKAGKRCAGCGRRFESGEKAVANRGRTELETKMCEPCAAKLGEAMREHAKLEAEADQ